ncbi:MAG TPA: MBL fold metallo-hydrolase [Methylomirabilota bacterium]|jgi:glyoxylase-like metal-dependent hydrolase (beta-lactamase superfamily II)
MPLDFPWSEPPAPGTTRVVAPGVEWLRMPLPFQLDHINLWLLADGAGWAIVDTGVGLDDVRALWDRVLAGRRVTRVIVTHFHPDHLGNAAWLTERHGVDLWCTQAEYLIAHVAVQSTGPRHADARLRHYRRHGCDEAALAALAKRGNHYPRLVPTLPEQFHCFREGDALTIGGRRWTVIVGRGHSPEHAALWCEEAGVLISGDQVLPRITTNISVWPDQPWGDPLRLYLESLDRFRDIGAGVLVLPAHGLPFRGLPERLTELRTHHAARLAETLDAITEPRSAAEVVPALFRRELDSHQLGFALGEALAHLHRVEADGRAVRVIGDDGVHRFRKA